MAAVDTFLCPELKYFCLWGGVWQLLLRGSQAWPRLEQVVAARSKMPQHPKERRTSQPSHQPCLAFAEKRTFTCSPNIN